jgi:hypothetical protein
MKTYLVSEAVLRLAVKVQMDMQEGHVELDELLDSIGALSTILDAPAAEPAAWMHPNEGLSYENHYVGNVPLYRKDA